MCVTVVAPCVPATSPASGPVKDPAIPFKFPVITFAVKLGPDRRELKQFGANTELDAHVTWLIIKFEETVELPSVIEEGTHESVKGDEHCVVAPRLIHVEASIAGCVGHVADPVNTAELVTLSDSTCTLVRLAVSIATVISLRFSELTVTVEKV
jgi:hypothetical protein